MKKILIALEIFLLAGIGGYLLFQETINQLFVDESAYRQGFYVPKDLEDSFDELDQILSNAERDSLKSLSSEDDLSMYHFGFGTYLRNRWGLWGGSRLSEYFNELEIFQPDDMSGIILTSYWRHLNDLPLEVDSQVKYYQDYWEQVDQTDILLQDLPAPIDTIKMNTDKRFKSDTETMSVLSCIFGGFHVLTPLTPPKLGGLTRAKHS